MAFHTVLEITNAFLKMFLPYFALVVLMTAIAGIHCEAGRMTGSAGCSTAMVQREGMLSIEFRRRPCSRGMTGLTICPE